MKVFDKENRKAFTYQEELLISDQLELIKRCNILHPIKELKKISPANIFIVNSEYHKEMLEDNEDSEAKEVNNIYRSSDAGYKKWNEKLHTVQITNGPVITVIQESI